MISESKFRLSMAFGILTIVVGTGGFVIIEGWEILDALYMTIITLSTVGFKEMHTLSAGGRVFTIFLIFFGAFAAAFFIKSLAGMVLEGQLQAILGKRKMEKNVQKLKNHIIICGYGRVGRKVALEFERREEPFVIIERDHDMIPDAQKHHFNFVVGNAADDDMLEQVGISRARAIVSTLPDDADNVYLALTARQINSALFIIARAETNLAKKKLIRAGADKVVCPHELGGTQMAMATLRPNVVDFMQLASVVPGAEQLGIEEVSIRSGGDLTGKTIIEAAVKTKYDAIVIGLRKKSGELTFNPSGETKMNPGDILVVLGESDKLENLAADLA
ncbi:MAG: potassium channel protein [FCB group bacterium]|nr:potassium channel protein [FCB group bacterium]